MKVVICLFMVVLGMIMNANALNELAQNGALAKVRIKVVDQDGLVVPEAKIWGGFTRSRRIDDNILVDGMTDKYGMFTAEGRCNDFLRFDVLKDGYYRSNIKICFWDSKVKPIVIDGKWQPYGAEKTVVLKKIKEPHRMKENQVLQQRKIKTYDQWFGYDLQMGDYLPPMGVGIVADMLVRFHRENRARDDWSISMDVSFTNYPYAGAYRLKKDMWSDMRSCYTADTNATYQTYFHFKFNHEKGVRPYSERLQEDEYLIFRTRTKVDKDGRLISARYGKLYGPWHFEDAGGSRIGNLFLNGQDNDLNLEDLWTVERAKKTQERRKSR